MDYAPVEAFLIGRCGKTITQSALTSLHEYELLVEGHAKVEQEQWERLRWEVFMQWAISPNLKRRPRTPQDVIKFPWEKEPTTPISQEDIDELQAEMDAINAGTAEQVNPAPL